MDKFDEFFDAYIDAALWSSNDDNDYPLDANYSRDDIDPDSLELLRIHALSFYRRIVAFLDADTNDVRLPADDITTAHSLAGHDFWLTANGHGAGFWDGDWPCYGDMFTKLSKCYPETDLYVGDDNKLHAW